MIDFLLVLANMNILFITDSPYLMSILVYFTH